MHKKEEWPKTLSDLCQSRMTDAPRLTEVNIYRYEIILQCLGRNLCPTRPQTFGFRSAESYGRKKKRIQRVIASTDQAIVAHVISL